MNKVESVLYKTRKTLREACEEAGVDFSEAWLQDVQECSNCSIWLKLKEMTPDYDNNLCCSLCLRFYGM